MSLAVLAAERSTCLNRKVGAVLVRDGMVFSTGYNGAAKGLVHCDKIGCIRRKEGARSGERLDLCRGAHAEANAIVQAAWLGVSTRGASMYCTLLPCPTCAALIINSGIKEVVYKERYAETLGYTMLKEAGVEIRQMEEYATEGIFK